MTSSCWLRPVVYAALGMALSACTLGPTFRRPDAPAPATYAPTDTEPLAADADTFAQHIVLGGEPQSSWWTLFKSPELDELITRAVERNQTLAAAKAALAQAQELLSAQTGTEYPQVSLDAGIGRQKYGSEFLGPLTVPPFTYFAVGPSVRYTLDSAGGIARSIEQRAALAQYQRSELDAAYLALTGNVVRQSLLTASSRAQIQAISDLLADDRNNLKLVQTAFENGSVSKVDVLTAQSQLASDETLLPPLRQELSIARHALAVLVGRAPADVTAPNLELGTLSLPRELPVSLPSQLVHRRPDILAAEAQLHAATAAVGVATANLYPRITLTASVSQQAPRPEELFNASSAAWTLISGLTAPLFDGGRLRAERRAALDALNESAANYQETVLQSFAQVADVLDALTHDADLLAAQSRALETAQSSVALARESYSAGNSGVLEVLDAQRTVLRAQLGYVRAQAQQYLDTTQLFLATGGVLPPS
jgi:NodT family efflux transporter outer membrane factor (OMF) lipoprotein